MKIDDSEMLVRSRYVSKGQIVDLLQQYKKRQQQLNQIIARLSASIEKAMMSEISIEDKEQLSAICKNEQQIWNSYLTIYYQLDRKTQKPYRFLVKRLKIKVDRHLKIINDMQYKQDDQVTYFAREVQQIKIEQESKFLFYLRGVIGLVGVIIMVLQMGAMYCWNSLNAYITSYYKLTNDPYMTELENKIGNPISMLAVTLSINFSFKFCQPFQKYHKLGKFFFLLLITFLSGLQPIFASYMPSFFLFVFFYNFLFGLCVGNLLLPAIIQCQNYFPNHKRLVISLVESGPGIGAIFFALSDITCMNPAPLSPNYNYLYVNSEDYIAYSMPPCISKACIYIWIFGLIGCIMFLPMLIYNNKQENIQIRIQRNKDYQNQCHSVEEAYNSPITWIIAIMLMLGSLGNFFFIMHFKLIPKDTIKNVQFLGNVSYFGLVSFAIFRIIFGLVLQKIGFKWTFFICMVFNIFSFSTIPFAVNSYEFYAFDLLLSQGVFGGMVVLMFNLCLLIYGGEVGNQIFGEMWLSLTLANWIQFFIGAILEDIVQQKYILCAFSLTSLIALIINCVVRYQGRWQNSLDKLEF